MISPDRLCIGLHIRLASWLGHPFLLSRFKINNTEQLALLRSIGLSEIEYLAADRERHQKDRKFNAPKAGIPARFASC